MNRKEAKEILPIIQAFAEGKTVQYQDEYDTWINCADDSALLDIDMQPWRYRIKPEPKYRPFKTAEECWNEMHKHPDFGWVRFKETSEYLPIEKVSDFTNYADIFEEYEFTDREPFGVKE